MESVRLAALMDHANRPLEKKVKLERLEHARPMEGTITAEVFENEHLKIPPTLMFSIEVPLEPFQFPMEDMPDEDKDEVIETSVQLDTIGIPVEDDWRGMAGQTYEFPVNPEDGYIDGSVYLGYEHNPVDATKLAFGAIEGSVISCRISLAFAFALRGYPKFEPVEWDVTLRFDEEEMDEVIEEAKKQTKG